MTIDTNKIARALAVLEDLEADFDATFDGKYDPRDGPDVAYYRGSILRNQERWKHVAGLIAEAINDT